MLGRAVAYLVAFFRTTGEEAGSRYFAELVVGSSIERAVHVATTGALERAVERSFPYAPTIEERDRAVAVLSELWPELRVQPTGRDVLSQLEDSVATALIGATTPFDDEGSTSCLDALGHEFGIRIDPESFARWFVDDWIDRIGSIEAGSSLAGLANQLALQRARRRDVDARDSPPLLVAGAEMVAPLDREDAPIDVVISFENVGGRVAHDVSIHVLVKGPDGVEVDETSERNLIAPQDATSLRAGLLLAHSGRVARHAIRLLGARYAIHDNEYTFDLTANYCEADGTALRGVRSCSRVCWVWEGPLAKQAVVSLRGVQTLEP